MDVVYRTDSFIIATAPGGTAKGLDGRNTIIYGEAVVLDQTGLSDFARSRDASISPRDFWEVD
ncbi:hypothetical protein NKH36_20905 [Mesorhizobium sp. M1312]|uniref:hypothetical protein n=1 Tax=unclassified Mesorhizobium TaxID=325217 RepID=UPI00333C02E1